MNLRTRLYGQIAFCCVVAVVFVLSAPLLAQGGFNRTAVSFGSGEYLVSDVAILDVDGDEEMDAIVASADVADGVPHRIYHSIMDAEPPAPVTIDGCRGGKALLAVANFDGSGKDDLVIVDGTGCRLYLNDGDSLELADSYTMDSYGEPVAVLAGAFVDYGCDYDLIIAYANTVVCLKCVYDQFLTTHYVVDTFGSGVSSVTGLNMIAGGMTELIVLSDETLFSYALGVSSATLLDSTGVEGACCIGWGTTDATKLAVFTLTNLSIYSYDESSEVWDETKSGEIPLGRRTCQVKAAELTGDSYCDFFVRAAGVTYILQQAELAFNLYEFVGYPDGMQDAAIVLADADDDSYLDLVVARSDAPHQVFLNRDRLEISIADADTVTNTPEGVWVEFQVTLDAAPVSLVVVVLEVIEEGEYTEDEDSDGLPDFREVVQSIRGQSVGSFVSTSTVVLAFPPGVGQNPALYHVWPFPPFHHHAIQFSVSLGTSQSGIGAFLGGGGGQAIIQPYYGSPGQPEWKFQGEVRATAKDSADRIYFGGDIQRILWEVPGEVATIDESGRKKLTIPPCNASNMTIHTLVAGANNSIYVGGDFTFTVYDPFLATNVTIKNIARITSNGEWDPYFRPNPTGAVYSIALGKLSIGTISSPIAAQTRVFIGGRFMRLEAQSQSDNDNRAVRNFATWPIQGNAEFTGVQINGQENINSVNNIRVSSETSATAGLPTFANDAAIVRTIAFADTPDGPRLVIGGSRCGSVRFGRPYATGRDATSIRNLAILALASSTYRGVCPKHIGHPVGANGWADWAPPWVTNHATTFNPPVPPNHPSTGNTAAVTHVAFAAETFVFGDDMSAAANAPAERAFVFAGSFTRVQFRRGETLVANIDDPVANVNLSLSTLGGHKPWVSGVPTTGFGIHSIAVDQASRVWVANDVATVTSADQPIWVYSLLTGGSPPTNGRLLREPSFDVGPNDSVRQLAYDARNNLVIAVGDFATRPASVEYTPTSTILQEDIPARNITAYSTVDAPPGAAWSGFGDHSVTFRGSLGTGLASGGYSIDRIAVLPGYDGGYALANSSQYRNLPWTLGVERTGLAAVDVNFNILDWGPRASGPVHAIEVDVSAFPDEIVYYGGQCHSFGLPDIAGQECKLMAALASDDAAYPVDWWTYVNTTSSPEPSINAIAFADLRVVFGGVFTSVAGASRDSAAAATLFDSASTPAVTGLQSPSGWAPDLYRNGALPVVNAIVVFGNNTYVGGDFEGTQSNPSLQLHALVECDFPTNGSGTVTQSFDLGLGVGEVVYALEIDSTTGIIYAAGALGGPIFYFGGPPHFVGNRVAAAWEISTQNHQFDISGGDNGTSYRGLSLAFANGKLVVGGNFTHVWTGSGTWQTRGGVAAFNKATGALDSWAPNPINNPNDRINTLCPYDPDSWLFLGGTRLTAYPSGLFESTVFP
jgi:hypothetical protein